MIRSEDGAREREIAVAQFLASARAPVVAPSDLIDPGPHAYDGLIVTFWDYVPDEEARKPETEAFETLAHCRASLASFPEPLPYMRGYNDARQLFHDLWRNDTLGAIDPGDTVRKLVEIDAMLDAGGGASSTSNVPLHGDAHLSNMLMDAGRGLWIDWEDVCQGPVEWDYACLIVSIRNDEMSTEGDSPAIATAIEEIDRDVLEILIVARNLQFDLWDTAIEVLNRPDKIRPNIFLRGVRDLRRPLGPR